MAEFPWQSHSRAGASATKRRPSNETTKTEPNLARNRKFESSSLQQGVRSEPCGTWGSRSLILLQRRASYDLTSWMNRAARIRCGSVCEVACASHAGGGIRSRSPGSRGVRLCERVKKRLRRL